MEPASELLTLSLGAEVDPSAAEDIVTTLITIDQVESARALELRAIDPASVIVLVQSVGGVIGSINALWDLVTKIRERLGRDRIHGARVTLPNGTRIDLESVTRDELAQVIELAGGKAGQRPLIQDRQPSEKPSTGPVVGSGTDLAISGHHIDANSE